MSSPTLLRGFIKGVLFDFDGVIAETLSGHIAAWKSVLPPRVRLTDDQIVRLNEGLPAYKIVREIYRTQNLSIHEESAKKLARKKNVVFRKSRSAQIYAGVEKMLQWAQKHFKLGLVTGTTRGNVDVVLDQQQQRYFQTIVTETDAEKGKPHPEPYLAGLQNLGLDAGNTIVIENAPMGIQAARSAGIFCVALTTTLSAVQLKDAELVLGSHRELFTFLQSITRTFFASRAQ